MRLVDYILPLLGTNILNQLFPRCLHLVGRCLVPIAKHVFDEVVAETFLRRAVCAVAVVSTYVSVSSADAVTAATVYMYPTQGVKYRNNCLLTLRLVFSCLQYLRM